VVTKAEALRRIGPKRIEQIDGVVEGKLLNGEQAGILFTDDEAGEIGVRLQTGARRMKGGPSQPT
jgi:hypothetical protein